MASRFDDIKAQLGDRLANLWSKISESSVYIQLYEKFEEQSPARQRIITVVGAVAVVGLILSVPYSFLSTAGEEMERFQNLRQLTRDLLRMTRTQEVAPVVTITAATLSSRIPEELRKFRLTPDQTGKVELVPSSEMASFRLAPPAIQEEAVRVMVKQLNVRQLVDVAHALSNLGETVKLAALTVQDSGEKGYFNATFVISAFSVQAPPEEKGSGKRGSRRRGDDG